MLEEVEKATRFPAHVEEQQLADYLKPVTLRLRSYCLSAELGAIAEQHIKARFPEATTTIGRWNAD
jgi:hypothetical protein